MEFAGYIARRYLRSRRHSRFLSRGSVTAIVGIAIGVAVLNITLAVMNGFHSEMRRTFVENMPMISIITSAPEGFTDLGRIMDIVGQDPEVVGVAPFIRQVGLATASRTIGPPRIKEIVAWGIEPHLVDTVQPLSRYLLPNASVLDDLTGKGVPRVILGADLANSLYAATGDTVVLTTVNGELDLDRIEAESRQFVVVGFFETGMFEFDSRFVYVDLTAAREFFGYAPGGASMIGVKVVDLMRADRVSDRLEDELGYDYYATDWMALNANLFEWIKLEKIIMILLLGMIILIAGFNIIGILTMMVGERRREIGILLAMGARRNQVMGVFLINGVWLGAVGVFFGSLVGLVVIWFLHRFGITLPGDVYFVETIPVLLQWGDFFLVAGISLLMALLAGLWPSWEASNLKPMDIIRYT
ncbi:MAG: ABC transporter permease [Candidatus Krumholzibacteria bacterium]|nr:ABC transporter permease [Candidatus Krumholzibacteria bacterium]